MPSSSTSSSYSTATSFSFSFFWFLYACVFVSALYRVTVALCSKIEFHLWVAYAYHTIAIASRIHEQWIKISCENGKYARGQSCRKKWKSCAINYCCHSHRSRLSTVTSSWLVRFKPTWMAVAVGSQKWWNQQSKCCPFAAKNILQRSTNNKQ